MFRTSPMNPFSSPTVLCWSLNPFFVFLVMYRIIRNETGIRTM